MHVISPKKLREFWAIHPEAHNPLKTWLKAAKRAGWQSFDAVKADFGKRADRVRQFVVFDIGGNKYRLIVEIDYRRWKVFVRHVLTHAEYDRGGWKEGE